MNPPLNKPSDARKYREQYLSNLQVEISNLQNTQNAVNILGKTGEVPEPLDNRSPEQIAGNRELSKATIRTFLTNNGYLGASDADNVVQSLTDAELEFILQQEALIQKYFTGKKVPPKFFLTFLRKLIKKTEETAGVEFGLQEETGKAILLSNKQILRTLIGVPDLERLSDSLERIAIANPSLRTAVEAVKTEVTALRSVIPTKELFDAIQAKDPVQRALFSEQINQDINEIPTKRELNPLLRELEISMRRNDSQRTTEILMQLRDMVALDEPTKENFRNLKTVVATPVKAGEGDKPPINVPPSMVAPVPVQIAPRINTLDDFASLTMADKKIFLIQTGLSKKLKKKSDGSSLPASKLKQANIGESNINEILSEWLQSGKPTPNKGKGLTGRGFMKPSIRFQARMEKKFERPKPYTQVGKYLINKKKLGEGILMVKSPCGQSVKNLPSERIEKEVVSILQTICGGGLPDYEHIDGLNKEQKEKLHKVLKGVGYDAVKIPNPKKNEEEQQNDRFNILKGQIIAGNDNKEMVKEFKFLLLKMLHDGRLPRREAQEILIDLTSLGY